MPLIWKNNSSLQPSSVSSVVMRFWFSQNHTHDCLCGVSFREARSAKQMEKILQCVPWIVRYKKNSESPWIWRMRILIFFTLKNGMNWQHKGNVDHLSFSAISPRYEKSLNWGSQNMNDSTGSRLQKSILFLTGDPDSMRLSQERSLQRIIYNLYFTILPLCLILPLGILLDISTLDSMIFDS